MCANESIESQGQLGGHHLSMEPPDNVGPMSARSHLSSLTGTVRGTHYLVLGGLPISCEDEDAEFICISVKKKDFFWVRVPSIGNPQTGLPAAKKKTGR